MPSRTAPEGRFDAERQEFIDAISTSVGRSAVPGASHGDITGPGRRLTGHSNFPNDLLLSHNMEPRISRVPGGGSETEFSTFLEDAGNLSAQNSDLTSRYNRPLRPRMLPLSQQDPTSYVAGSPTELAGRIQTTVSSDELDLALDGNVADTIVHPEMIRLVQSEVDRRIHLANRVHRAYLDTAVSRARHQSLPRRAHIKHFTSIPATGTTEDPECPICFEDYDELAHRAVRLQNVVCDHIFGRSCIQAWVNSQMPNAHRCPSYRRSIVGALAGTGPSPPRAARLRDFEDTVARSENPPLPRMIVAEQLSQQDSAFSERINPIRASQSRSMRQLEELRVLQARRRDRILRVMQARPGLPDLEASREEPRRRIGGAPDASARRNLQERVEATRCRVDAAIDLRNEGIRRLGGHI
ncbi:hypothetical protein DE146DRAFT_642721 [Phaeosphaeria sp. MPI-PUGE-AT-0046c]|nr:hypothetical protein DE146DRAFT_642721 [Phaeosphaeria sp. MPI-PUGE-AT-0046c]